MSNWQDDYKSKLTSFEGAAKLISKGERVFLGTAVPEDIVRAFSKRLPELGFTTLIGDYVGYEFEFLMNPEYKNLFKIYELFPSELERSCPNSANIEIIPHHLSQFEYLMRNHLKPDVVLLECTAPDANGYMSYSLGGSDTDVLTKLASKLIVQVNSRLPFVGGEENLIHVSKVDAIVENDHELYEVPEIPITETEEKIARLIVDRIEDGSTIQLGIGGLANAIGYFLESKKDLGIHTEILTDSMVELAKKGVVTGKKKTLHPGLIVYNGVLGTRALYDFVDNNPTVAQLPISYVNDPYIIAKNDNFVSINNALMVDLTGQVGSESLGFKQYSNTGGQVEYARGAYLAKNGQSYICLNSTTTTKNGLISRIVLKFPPGQVVTTPRTDVQYIATEYGIAELRGKSISERVKAMINIAHPQFRDELTSEAKKVGILY